MLSITRISAQGQSAGVAMLAYLKATEYYTSADHQVRSASQWLGNGAIALGLSGDVDETVMDHLAKGFAPDGTTALCRNAGELPQWVAGVDSQGQPLLDARGQPRGTWKGGHRVGFDLTFSSEKTFSLLYAMAEPKERDRLLAAHHAAVGHALDYMESQVETRRGKGGRDKLAVQGLVVSRHTHFAGREEKDDDGNAAWDPQIHSHCLVYGVAQGEDGQWSTFDAEALYEHKMTAGALYRAELAYGLRQLGYGIDKKVDTDDFGRETGKVYFRVAGMPEDMRAQFSKRRAAILDYMDKHPAASSHAATLATRRSKDEPTYAELTDIWTRAFDGMRQGHRDLPTSSQALKGRPDTIGGIDDDAMLKKLHGRSAVFTRKDLMYHLAQEEVGRTDIAGIGRLADAFLARTRKRHDLVDIAPARRPSDEQVGAPGRKHTERRYAAQWVVAMEQELVRRTRDRRADERVQVPEPLVEQACQAFEARKGFAMSAEQRDAVRYLTSGSGGTAVLVGRAGSGKTTSVGAAVAAWQTNGQEVLGVATAWKAAHKLEAETGIASVSVASLLKQLDQGAIALSPKSVVLLDEAGMVGTEHLVALQRRVDTAGGKLVMMGDPKQLQPVEWGGGLRLAQHEGSAELADIRRQAAKADRDTAQLFYALPSQPPGARSRATAAAHGGQIWQQLEHRGQITACDTKQGALDRLVHEAVSSPAPWRDKLLLGASRDDVAALNRRARTALKQRGELGSADFTAGEGASSTPIACGERLAFTRRVQSLGVVNGSTIVVTAIRPGQQGGLDVEAVVESDILGEQGRTLRWNTEQTKHGHCLTSAYASTVHKAQGASVGEVYQLANPGMADEQLGLVGFTRMKHRYMLYGAHEDLQRMAERYGTDRLAMNATEEGIGSHSVPPKRSVKRPLDAYVERVKAWWKEVTRATPSPGQGIGR